MNREEIIRMAQGAGIGVTSQKPRRLFCSRWASWHLDIKHLERFANLVAAAEREACAKLCEDMGRGHGSAFAEFDCADAIRARQD